MLRREYPQKATIIEKSPFAMGLNIHTTAEQVKGFGALTPILTPVTLSCMETNIIADVPFEISEEGVFEVLKITRRNPTVERAVRESIEMVRSIARPKILYKISYIERRGEDSLVIDGVEFKSRILRVNTEKAERLFPYVATAGRELESLPVPKDDFMKTFCLDAVKEMILMAALGHFERRLSDVYALGAMAHMNPGSLNDWPVSEQPKLFSVFGNVEELIGVRLRNSHLMDPLKSVSGIYFPTEVDFRSCMLCPRHSCIRRRAEYDPHMAARYR
jgi:hypothetical protein